MATAHGVHRPPNRSNGHLAEFELNLFRTKSGLQVHLCKTCDEYASEATVTLGQICRLCGEKIEEASTSDPAGEFIGNDGEAVIAHAQCGLNHGLKLA